MSTCIGTDGMRPQKLFTPKFPLPCWIVRCATLIYSLCIREVDRFQSNHIYCILIRIPRKGEPREIQCTSTSLYYGLWICKGYSGAWWYFRFMLCLVLKLLSWTADFRPKKISISVNVVICVYVYNYFTNNYL